MADKLKFIKCTATEWTAASSMYATLASGTIVFVSGDTETKVPGAIYVTNGTTTPDKYAVNTNIVDVSSKDATLTFALADGTTKDITVGLDKDTKDAIDALKELLDEDLNISLMYNSAMDDTLATVNALGGIAAGTTAASLKEKTLSQVLDDLLFPTVQPTMIQPSVSIAVKSPYKATMEVGTDAPKLLTDFTITTNRGKATIGSKSVDYAGEATDSQLTVGDSNAKPMSHPYVTSGTTKYNYTVTFSDGVEIKDSKGGKATTANPNPWKSAPKSASCTIVGRYPIYATTSVITAYEKTLPTAAEIVLTLVGESDENKQSFKLYKNYTINSIEMLNTLSGQYEAYDIKGFTTTSEQIDVNEQAKDVEYTVYTRNEGTNGAGTFKLKLTYGN